MHPAYKEHPDLAKEVCEEYRGDFQRYTESSRDENWAHSELFEHALNCSACSDAISAFLDRDGVDVAKPESREPSRPATETMRPGAAVTSGWTRPR